MEKGRFPMILPIIPTTSFHVVRGLEEIEWLKK
jgi:hypothetical protein